MWTGVSRLLYDGAACLQGPILHYPASSLVHNEWQAANLHPPGTQRHVAWMPVLRENSASCAQSCTSLTVFLAQGLSPSLAGKPAVALDRGR